MRTNLIAALVMILSVAQANASYKYPNGVAKLSKPSVKITGDKGASIDLTSGPVAVEIEGKPLMYGSGFVSITSAQGTVRIAIPKANYTEKWKFLVGGNGQSVNLQGADSIRTSSQPTREEVVRCDITPYDLPVMDNNNTPVMIQVPSATAQSGQQQQGPTSKQLVIRLCSQTVDGKTSMRQVGPYASCEGNQRVVKQASTSTEVYTINLLDPASGQSLGTIEATASVSQNDGIVRTLTACQ